MRRAIVPLTTSEITEWIDKILHFMKEAKHKPRLLPDREFEVVVGCHQCEKVFYVHCRQLMAEGSYVRSWNHNEIKKFVCGRLEIMR